MTTVTLERRAHVATVTLNRPARRNALNQAMCDDLLECTAAIARDADVRVALIRALGPVFCAGADLHERRGMTDDQVRVRRQRAFEAYAALEALPMPTMAVVQGPAIGSGCEIAAACDFIIATTNATFRTPEALLGTVGATQRLPRIVGPRLAKDLMFTGRTLTASDAVAAGLVSRLVEPTDLDAVVASVVSTIVAGPPLALRVAKRCIDRGVELDRAGALALELDAIDEILSAGADARMRGTAGERE